MTTLVVETGAGLSNSNSYVTVAEADTYLSTNKYYSAWADYDDEDKANVLIIASRLIDSYMNWFGTKTVESSAMRWPREGVYSLDGVEISSVSIPQNLKNAVCEFAYTQYSTNREQESGSLGISELKVDVIELKFDKTDRPFTMPNNVIIWLRGLGYPVEGSKVLKLGRS